ncbi:MAG TPA: hypothetical protein VME86_04340 [Acidobacteriaceae bacterium]|nr:hypothetical protein [Acidobacteriaceae bacterium]
MRVLKYFSLIALAGCLFLVSPSRSQAQVAFSVNIGPAPVCPYGYYAFPPYYCAPYGYYGPTWFVNGIFIGAGPWFHGPHGFHGYINHYYDPRYGYHGPYPARGSNPDWNRHPNFRQNFHGNEQFDGRGPAVHTQPHYSAPHGSPYGGEAHNSGHPAPHGSPHGGGGHGNDHGH